MFFVRVLGDEGYEWYSCSERTSSAPRLSDAIASAAARAAAIVVKYGTSCVSAVRRMQNESRIACAVEVVLMTSANSPFDDRVDEVRAPFEHLVDAVGGEARVARRTSRCRAWRRCGSRARGAARATSSTGALSSSRTLMNARPADAAAACRRRAAPWRTRRAKSSSMPMTSPVELISGPSSVSTPGKRTNGKTGLFHARRATARFSRDAQLRERAADHARARRSSRAARPVAFETNGTVRDARGFTSST